MMRLIECMARTKNSIWFWNNSGCFGSDEFYLPVNLHATASGPEK